MQIPKSFSQGNVRCDISQRALEMWNPNIKAAVETGENTITIYGPIGDDWYYEGVTLSRIDAALRSIGDNPVTVYINSPGGDMFEGIAIYNRLREHSKPVTTKVIGMAASAASVIFMAGNDDMRFVAKTAFLMIHNCWCIAVGNRHHFRLLADDMEEFDAAMADLYIDGSGNTEEDVKKWMDEETYMRGVKAVELGFADGLLDKDELTESESGSNASAIKKMDALMAKAGLPRAERRKLFNELKSGTQNATGADMPSAVGTDTQNAVLLQAAEQSAAISSSLLSILGK